MQTPSREAWGIVNRDDLDAAWAFDTFCGRTFQEARALFAKHAVYYQECLGAMPAVPFRFYVRAFIDYLASEDSKGDSDGASSFLALLLEMYERHRELLDSACEALMMDTARHIAVRQEHYGADVEIYGEFVDHLRNIELARVSADPSRQAP